MTVKAAANCNFQVLGGADPHKARDARYQEYRKAWFERPAGLHPGSFPVHLDVESTNRCNLKCTFCDKLPFLSAEQIGDMDYELYKQIIDEGVSHGLFSVKLSYRGEPLLHKRLVDMVSYAKEKGLVDVYFNTNGTLLTEDISRELIRVGLDRISVSVEGTDAEAFETARVGAKFERIKNNVSNLLRLREEAGAKFPQIRIQTVALPGIDLDEYARYWGPYCDETAAVDYKEADDIPRRLVGTDWACPQLWQRMTIEWDGTIHPCNNDDQGNMVIGHAGKDSLSECWNSRLTKTVREHHVSGTSHEVEACDVCPWRTTQLQK